MGPNKKENQDILVKHKVIERHNNKDYDVGVKSHFRNGFTKEE